jgi:hypothetical protein
MGWADLKQEHPSLAMLSTGTTLHSTCGQCWKKLFSFVTDEESK